jgi:hypothetical protein
MRRVALINSYYPPDAAITGQSLAELAHHLLKRDPRIHVRVYTSSLTYVRRAVGSAEPGVETVRIGPASRMKGKLGRLFQSVLIGRGMAREATAWADVIVSLTDPPLLGLWIGSRRARAKRPILWIEWTMDLFPEALVAAKLVSSGSPLYRLLVGFQRKHAAPDAFICLGEAQSEAIKHLRAVNRPTVVVPCGIVEHPGEAASVPAWRQNEHRIVIAYAGNLGAAHCPHFLPALTDAADPNKFAFLFSLHGSHADKVRQQLWDRNNIVWKDQISHAEMVHADVHAASLHPDWTHICVPSKAVTTICLGRPLLFAGEPRTDTARMLESAAWLVAVPRDGRYDRATLEQILRDISDPEKRSAKTREAKSLADQLRAEKDRAFDNISELIVQGLEGR